MPYDSRESCDKVKKNGDTLIGGRGLQSEKNRNSPIFRYVLFGCGLGFISALVLVQFFIFSNPLNLGHASNENFDATSNKIRETSSPSIKQNISKIEILNNRDVVSDSEISVAFKPRNPFINLYRTSEECKNFNSAVKYLTDTKGPSCSISRQLNAAYVHVPRAASSAIRGNLVQYYPKIEFSECQSMRLLSTEPIPYTFTFVREPIERAKSGLTEYIRRLPKKYEITETFINDQVDMWLDDLENGVLQKFLWQHIIPQSFHLTSPFVLDQIGTISFIGQVEALEEHYSLLLQSLGGEYHKPEGGYRCCNSERSQKIKNLVARSIKDRDRMIRLCHIYAQDYVCLGYSKPPLCETVSMEDNENRNAWLSLFGI